MDVWKSYGLCLGALGALWFYYGYFNKSTKRKHSEAPRNNAASSRARRRSTSPISNTPRDTSRSGASTPKQGKKSKQKKDKPSRQASPAPNTNFSAPADGDEPEVDTNDREWAQQLSAARQGVTLSVPERNQRQKSPRRQKAVAATNEAWDEPEAQSQAPSTSTGRLEDAVVANAGDVSDMLEPAAPGPSVLRVTGEEKAKKAKAPQTPAAPQETKKQRQNRKKAEEKKLAREQEEEERKIAEEKQRRTAREARGEPAKNGLGAASVPASSAWSQAPNANGVPSGGSASTVKNGPLLDTFEHDAVSTSSSNELATNPMTPSTSASTLEQEMPSEEVQMQMLNQINGDAGWNEVTKPKKGKKNNTNATASPERLPKENIPKPKGQYAGISTTDLISKQAKIPQPPSAKAASTNGFAALEAATGFTPGRKGHPEDSDWAVE